MSGSTSDEDEGGAPLQLQIVVAPMRRGDGAAGAEIQLTSGPPTRSGRRLPSIYNSQEMQWISSRRGDSTSIRYNYYERESYHQRCGPCRSRVNRSAITKYDVNVNRGYNNTESHNMPPSTRISDDSVAQYLRSHPDFLEKFLMEEVELEQLERWIIRKSQKPRKKEAPKNGRKISLSKWKFCVHADKRKMLQDLTYSLQHKPTKKEVLWELANCISSAVDADGFRVYLPNRNELHHWSGPYAPKTKTFEPSECQVAQHVWKTKRTIRISRGDPLFPAGSVDEDIHHILCQPVLESHGEFVAVLELCRRQEGGAFHEEDEEIALSYLVWGGIALHYAQLYLNMDKQRRLNDFLLAVVKSIFQDMVSMDSLVIKIMNFAQELVDADRASLFLVDAKSQQLYATIFDVRLKHEGDDGVQPTDLNEIRFPLGTGIAGQVALTGEILNIPDAYADPRFNGSVDQLTGYKTNSILCMPIFKGKGSIIGVVQMVNKRCGVFTKEDEEAFDMFAMYCGLALHHAKLYDKITKSEQKYRVALEVLSYHNTCSEEEFKKATKDGVSEQIIGVDDYYFNPFDLKDYEKARHAIYMFIDLFGLARFDKNSLLRFTLTVRKNYRRVPYHNWTHGFSVANSMYSIIKHSENVFRPNECLALYIGALCHDLDHRGKNNKFMLDTESPLANIYSTSTMEHHHFNQTVTILQQEGHNIFSKLSSHEYKQVLNLLKHCILATDLALFFPTKSKLNALIKDNQFSWLNPEHRLLIQAIAMTGSDLSASAKPWDVQVRTVEVIFQEFYDQGDAEKAAGRTPIPMMDRNQPDQQPASQVGFLTGICTPCYALLHQLIPQTKALLDMCQKNLTKWKDIDRRIKEEDLVYGKDSIKNI